MRQFTCLKAVTHPSTNRARCKATALIETNALPLHQTANPKTTGNVREHEHLIIFKRICTMLDALLLDWGQCALYQVLYQLKINILLIVTLLCMMCYLANWNPYEIPMMDFLKAFLLNLEMIVSVRYCTIIFFQFISYPTSCEFHQESMFVKQ